MDILIEEYNEKDNVALQDLIKLIHEEDDLPFLLSVLKDPGLKCAYTAFLGETSVGMIIAWTSSYHASCVYFRLIVHPFYHHSEVKEKLFRKVEALESDLPLQTSLWETTVGTKGFLEQKGFDVLRKTYMPLLAVHEYNNLGLLPFVTGKLKPLDEIVSDDVLLKKVLQLAKKNYEETHSGNPITDMSLVKWKNLILEDACDLKGSYVLVDANESRVIAYSFIHVSDDSEKLELGFSGCLKAHDLPCIPQLISHQIRYANEHGYSYLEGEFDTTSKYAMEVLQSIPFPPCAAWVTYRRH